MTFKEQCDNLAEVDKHIWQDSFYYVSFWYYWYGIKCQCVRRFCTSYSEAVTFIGIKMFEILKHTILKKG